MKPKAIRIDAVPFRPALSRTSPLLAVAMVAVALLLAVLAGTAG